VLSSSWGGAIFDRQLLAEENEAWPDGVMIKVKHEQANMQGFKVNPVLNTCQCYIISSKINS